MSLKMACLSPSVISPIAIPATGAFSGAPALMRARLPPQTDAIDEEPLDSIISDTMRIVYGKSS